MGINIKFHTPFCYKETQIRYYVPIVIDKLNISFKPLAGSLCNLYEVPEGQRHAHSSPGFYGLGLHLFVLPSGSVCVFDASQTLACLIFRM